MSFFLSLIEAGIYLKKRNTLKFIEINKKKNDNILIREIYKKNITNIN